MEKAAHSFVEAFLYNMQHNENYHYSLNYIRIQMGTLAKNGITRWKDLMNKKHGKEFEDLSKVNKNTIALLKVMRMHQIFCWGRDAMQRAMLDHDVGLRIFNILWRNNIRTYYDLMDISDEDLLKLKGIGPKLLEKIKLIKKDDLYVKYYDMVQKEWYEFVGEM